MPVFTHFSADRRSHAAPHLPITRRALNCRKTIIKEAAINFAIGFGYTLAVGSFTATKTDVLVNNIGTTRHRYQLLSQLMQKN